MATEALSTPLLAHRDDVRGAQPLARPARDPLPGFLLTLGSIKKISKL